MSQLFNQTINSSKYSLSVKFQITTPQTIQIEIAHADMKSIEIPMEIAENSPREDWIVVEAIEFPGINFYWLGSILMISGMLISLIHKKRVRRALHA